MRADTDEDIDVVALLPGSPAVSSPAAASPTAAGPPGAGAAAGRRLGSRPPTAAHPHAAAMLPLGAGGMVQGEGGGAAAPATAARHRREHPTAADERAMDLAAIGGDLGCRAVCAPFLECC